MGDSGLLTTLEVASRLSGITIETIDLVDKWLLITYDVPHSPEGDKARREFLNRAHMIGATQHSESTYLLPWNQEAEALALRLSKASVTGKVCVWTSSVTDTERASEITEMYDHGMEKPLKEIEIRIDKVAYHLQKQHFKLAEKMVEKTDRLITALKSAIIRRGSQDLFLTITILERRFNSLFGRI